MDRYLKRKVGGTFVDIGGYDGVTGSNTAFFEKWRKWTGVLVEPVPANLERARVMRDCPCWGYAVSDSEATAEFITVTEGFTQMSGLSSSYDADMLREVRANPHHKEDIIEVPTKPLSTILQEADLPHPDFVSLDIEGGELAALQVFPFADHHVGMWAIENNTAHATLWI